MLKLVQDTFRTAQIATEAVIHGTVKLAVGVGVFWFLVLLLEGALPVSVLLWLVSGGGSEDS